MVKETYGKKSVVIILTASANPDDEKKASTLADVSEYRSKPLTDVMVNEIVEKYFRASSGIETHQAVSGTTVLDLFLCRNK